MPRYRLITSHTPTGGYREFTAADDAAAVADATASLYGARIVTLHRVEYTKTGEVLHRVEVTQ